jgi:hypothetical protein
LVTARGAPRKGHFSVKADRQRWRRTAQALALRARIVLACAGSDGVIAQQRGVSRMTVMKWRSDMPAWSLTDRLMRRAAGHLARPSTNTSSA